MEMVYGRTVSPRMKQDGDTILVSRLNAMGLRTMDDKERWNWSERRGLVMTPRRTPDS